MSKHNVVMLPTAAAEKVVQIRRAGRLPKSIPGLRQFQLRREHLRHQQTVIGEEIDSLQQIIRAHEQIVSRAKRELAQLQAVRAGSADGERVADYLWWRNLPRQDQQSLERSGYAPLTWPL